MFSDMAALRKALAGSDVRIVGERDVEPARCAPSVSAVASEYDEQVRLVAACDALRDRHPELRLLFAVPNGEYRPKRTAARLKAAGVRAGVPDLVLPVARGGRHSLMVELKVRGGRVSAEQQAWHDALRAEGVAVVVCWGADEALAAILRYLGGRSVDDSC